MYLLHKKKSLLCLPHCLIEKWSLEKGRNNTPLGLNISQNLKLLCVSNCYLSHQAAACEDLRKEPLCYKRQQRTIWLDEWVSSLCADKVPCNKKGIIKFRGTLLWIWQVVPTLGREQGRLVRSICLWIGSSKKSEGKMVDKLTGKEAWGLYWLPIWLNTAAPERNTSVYPCGRFYPFTWHRGR